MTLSSAGEVFKELEACRLRIALTDIDLHRARLGYQQNPSFPCEGSVHERCGDLHRVLQGRLAPVEFTTAGPFGLVRHPIYLGWMLIVFGSPLMTMSRLVMAIVSSLYLVMAIAWEERSLVDSFGNGYRTYQAKVPWRLIPKVW